MPVKMIRVYTASKLHHAEMWKQLCDSTKSVFFHARWLKHTKLRTPEKAENAEIFWVENQEDIESCDALLCYAVEGDYLRGALVEVGMAIACGKPVYIVGDNFDFGTWEHHPMVRRYKDLKGAIAAMRTYY